MVANMSTIFCFCFARGVLRRLSFLDNLKSLDKKLDLQRTRAWDFIYKKTTKVFFHLVRHTDRFLKQSLSRARILDRLVHIFIVVYTGPLALHTNEAESLKGK